MEGYISREVVHRTWMGVNKFPKMEQLTLVYKINYKIKIINNLSPVYTKEQPECHRAIEGKDRKIQE